MKPLITGGAGFIGSALVRMASEGGHTVINVDKLTYASNLENLNTISDTTPTKQGKSSPCAHVPIRPYEDFVADHPHYTVVFTWNHIQEIMEKEQAYKAVGGKWINFVPKVDIQE